MNYQYICFKVGVSMVNKGKYTPHLDVFCENL